jgi:Kef-type K+ transport system membrane component KefB
VKSLVVPGGVVELLLGVLIGPQGLELAELGDILEFLGELGLGFLFFFAG